MRWGWHEWCKVANVEALKTWMARYERMLERMQFGSLQMRCLEEFGVREYADRIGLVKWEEWLRELQDTQIGAIETSEMAFWAQWNPDVVVTEFKRLPAMTLITSGIPNNSNGVSRSQSLYITRVQNTIWCQSKHKLENFSLFRIEREYRIVLFYRAKSKPTVRLSLLLLIIIMSSERPSETNRIRKFAGSFKQKLSSLLNSLRAPTPPSIEMTSSSSKTK